MDLKNTPFGKKLLENTNSEIKRQRVNLVLTQIHNAFHARLQRMHAEMLSLKISAMENDDIYPSHSTSLAGVAPNFDAEKFVEKDLELANKREKMQWSYDIAVKIFSQRFGYTPQFDYPEVPSGNTELPNEFKLIGEA